MCEGGAGEWLRGRGVSGRNVTEELEPLVVELCPEGWGGEGDVQLLLEDGVAEELRVELLRKQVHVDLLHDGGHEPERPECAM